MKSVKPGRGPSMMGAISSVFAVIFGIIWTFAAASMGAPFFFPLFGLVFIIMGIVQAVYNFKNATSENRYSSFDIVDSREEADPWNERFTKSDSSQPAQDGEFHFCPYCGEKLGEGYEFCPKCGKRLQ
jgi:hypothetical protein